MDKEILKRAMHDMNPWWREESKPQPYKERAIYKEISRYMPKRQIVALTGLRRVGKTFLLLKVIAEYVQKQFPKKNILYFTFDDVGDARVDEIIDLYEQLAEKSIDSEEYLFVFDEIQKVKNWEEQLKRIYDFHPNIKFLISGSESLFIRRKSRESLAGRIYEFHIHPLSFREYLSFKGRKFDNLLLWKEDILKEFRQFLSCNGFPEIVAADAEESRKYIQESIIDRIVFRDLAEVFGVRDTTLVNSIFNGIYNNPCQIIEIQSLAQELGITRQALSEYLEYLEEAYLIKKLYNFSRNARKTQRRLKKYCATIINPLLIKDDFPKVFEQVLTLQLNAEYFWRDSYQNEVDIIIPEPLTAIEVKSGEIKERDLASLQKFIRKFKPQKSFVFSYDTEKKISTIQIIPFYKHLLNNG